MTDPGPRGASPRLARSAALMAVGTGISRLTGLLRLLALVVAVKTGTLADAYNLANTMPNIVVDLLLGGVLSATFVPVFVERLAARSKEEATEALSAVASVTLLVIGAASVTFLAASPLIIRLMTGLSHSTTAAADRRLATELLLLFVPQLTCYGFIGLATALLNARERFAAPMFAPIANNLVLIAVLVTFGVVVRNPTVAGVEAHRSQLLLLGLGTTAGVAVQAAALLPSLRRAGLGLRWSPRFGHEAVRRIVRLSGWTFGLVVTNQVALIVVLALAEKVGPGSVSAYTYAYTFFQLPYAVVAVSIMTATVPRLAGAWTRGDLVVFRRRLAGGLRSMLAVIIPAAAGLVVLARPLLLLLGAAIGHRTATGPTGTTLSMLAVGLPGFCVFQYAVRVLQSIQDLRTAFRLYLLENALNIVGALLLVGPLGIEGIALSISIAYTLAAGAGLVLVRQKVGGLDGDLVTGPLGRIVSATVLLVVASAAGVSVTGSESTPGLALRVLLGVVAGAVAYLLAVGALGALADRGRGPARAPEPLPDPLARREPGTGTRRRRGVAPVPGRPSPLLPAGRPPSRPTLLGPTRKAPPVEPGMADSDPERDPRPPRLRGPSPEGE